METINKIKEDNIFECKLPTYENFNMNKDGVKDLIVKRWSDMGFTKGLIDKKKDDMSYVFEEAAHKFIDNDEKTIKASDCLCELWNSMSYEMDAFAILRRINTNLEYKLEYPYNIDKLSDFIINNYNKIGESVVNDLLYKGFNDKEKVAKLDMEAIYCASIEKLIILEINK
jgi:hypothetical protein